MSRIHFAGLILCLFAGCNEKAPPATTSDSNASSPIHQPKEDGEWPEKQASHSASVSSAAASLGDPLADDRVFSADLGKLATTALQLENFSDYESAQEVRREILEKLQRRYGSKSWQATNARLALAHTERLAELTFDERGKLVAVGEAERGSASLAEQGQAREALDLAVQAVDLTREVWGDDYYLTANRWFDAAQLYRALGENASAEQLYLKTLSLRKRILGREHPDYVAVLDALAVHYQVLGEFDRAEKILREAGDLDKVIWGERHPAYATQLNNLGMMFHAAGKPAAAVDLLNESAEIRRESLGAEHPLFAHSLYNLGSIYYALEDYEQAAPQFDEALPIFESELGPGHQLALLAKHNLAMVEVARKNLGQAEKLVREVVETVREHSGEDSTSYASALYQLAVIYSHQANYAEADALLAQSQQIQERALGVDHPNVGKTLELRAAVLRKANRATEANRLEARAKEIARAASDESRQ